MAVLVVPAFVACSSSSSATGGRDAGTPYDAGVTTCDGGRCFACGETSCAEGSYCQSTFASMPDAIEMGVCKPTPAPCASTPTCECLNVNATIENCGQPPQCFDDGAGHLTLQCHYS